MPSPPFLDRWSEGDESTGSGAATSGPRVVPSLAKRWSHTTGGTHLQVVPCHWRATVGAPVRAGVCRMGHLVEHQPKRRRSPRSMLRRLSRHDLDQPGLAGLTGTCQGF